MCDIHIRLRIRIIVLLLIMACKSIASYLTNRSFMGVFGNKERTDGDNHKFLDIRGLFGVLLTY